MPNRRIPFGPIVAGAGAMLCIAALASLERFTQEGLWLMAPFGATMVIVFGLPDSPLAQPRNIVFGHLLTTAVGLTAAHYLGVTPWSLGAAVGLALFLMLVTQTMHPPAGANPVLVIPGAGHAHRSGVGVSVHAGTGRNVDDCPHRAGVQPLALPARLPGKMGVTNGMRPSRRRRAPGLGPFAGV
jgi:CBS-domain-containing membrane protein